MGSTKEDGEQNAGSDGQPSAGPAEGVDLSACLQRVADTQDEAAFESLYSDLAPRIKHYMMATGTDPAMAEEVAQEAMVRVWNRAESYNPEKANPSTWVFAIARNLRIDRIRRERVLKFSQELPKDFEEQPSPEPTPEATVGDRMLSERVREALADLPDDQREVIALSFINGLSHSEIADRLDVPLGTIKSRIRIAYQKLRPVLINYR